MESGPIPLPDADTAIAVAREWATKKGWDLDRYTFSVSTVQSCPLGVLASSAPNLTEITPLR